LIGIPSVLIDPGYQSPHLITGYRRGDVLFQMHDLERTRNGGITGLRLSTPCGDISRRRMFLSPIFQGSDTANFREAFERIPCFFFVFWFVGWNTILPTPPSHPCLFIPLGDHPRTNENVRSRSHSGGLFCRPHPRRRDLCPPLHSGNDLSATCAYFLLAYGALPTSRSGF